MCVSESMPRVMRRRLASAACAGACVCGREGARARGCVGVPGCNRV